MTIGPYTGALADDFRDPECLEQLGHLGELVRSDKADIISSGRNLNAAVDLTCSDGVLRVFVKSFGRQAWLRDGINRARGSKARRSWLAACRLRDRGVGTPAPIGYLERSEGGRLVESYFLSECEQGMTSFKDELARLFREDAHCYKVIELMQCVADAVRAMHAAGFQHNDLGNQNILLRRLEDAVWGDVRILDLNRGRLRDALSPAQRARDISRLYLPSDLLRVFKEMYYVERPPEEFQKWERFYRRAYAWHSATRSLRHPVRSRRQARGDGETPAYPPERDLWLWDERSGQAVSTLVSKDRHRHYPFGRHARIAAATVAAFPGVWREYKACLASCYGTPVALHGRVGITLDPDPATFERERVLLDGLGRIPVQIRFYCHEAPDDLAFRAGVVKALHEDGHDVSLALVQNRQAVLDSGYWREFVSQVLTATRGRVALVEVGHAINRVKWGLWGLDEQRQLAATAVAVAQDHPDVRLAGPAVIDFEYPYVLAALARAPDNLHFHALSHHLYVDRRGAPENYQGRFSTLEKCALGRAIARWSPRCDDRFIVSEVNWPLTGTGVYSPVNSPYESPGPRHNDPGVSEDDYGDYMIRYLLIAICSGMVDRVYWWRLVARGFGLVDDTDPDHWRARKAYRMLRTFLAQLGRATFTGREELGSGGSLWTFVQPDGGKTVLGVTQGGREECPRPAGCRRVIDAEGHELATDGGRIVLSGSPVYWLNPSS